MGESFGKTDRCIGIGVSRGGFTAAIIGADDTVESTRTVAITDETNTVAELIAFVTGLNSELGPFSRMGIALPGLIDGKAGVVALSANNPALTGVNVVKAIAGSTGIAVVLENDANAAAYGEYMLGSGRGGSNFFYITLGEGVGGAFILNGELWHGKGGFAGEFGFVPIDAEGVRLEEVASSENIVRRTRSRFRQDSTSSLNNMDDGEITIGAIIDAAAKKDEFSQMMLKRTGWYVGTAVATVINLLNIEKVIVAGEIVRVEQLVINSIISRSRELTFEPFFDSTVFVPGALGGDASAIGAAFLSK